MVLLSEPDERRLWVVVSALLGVAIVLMLASFQFPWFTASLTQPGVEIQGEFDFQGSYLAIFDEGTEIFDQEQDYGDDSPFGTLMDRVELLVGIGVFGAIALAGLLFLHRKGWFSNAPLIAVSWIVGIGGMAAGLTSFTLGAGAAGADEVMQLISSYPATQDAASLHGRPDPVFWGTQDYAGGELGSSPGVGWLLAILALLNLAAATLLLYQFPAGAAQAQEDEAQDFQVQATNTPKDPPLVAHGPSSRG